VKVFNVSSNPSGRFVRLFRVFQPADANIALLNECIYVRRLGNRESVGSTTAVMWWNSVITEKQCGKLEQARDKNKDAYT